MTFRSILLPIACLAAAPLAAQDAVQTGQQTAATPSLAPATRGAQPTGGSLAVTSAPGKVSTLFTNIATSPTSDVPGLPGVKFTPGSGSTSFDKPFTSPNGAHWTIRADTPLATAMDSILLVDGTVVVQEGTQAPFAPATFNYGQVDIRNTIQDNGDYVFFTNTTEPANDDYVIKVTAGPTYTVVAQELMAIPALPGATYDDDLDSTTLLSDGRVALRAIGIDGAVTTGTDQIFVIDNTLIAQEGVTIPAGQDAGGTLFWEILDFENQWVSPDGLNILLMGDLTGTVNDDIVVYNGTVVLQEGVILAGSGFVSPVVAGGADEISMDNAGRWYARGNNVDGSDWVLRQGVVIAQRGAPIGATGGLLLETWSDTEFADGFFGMTGNAAGDYVVAGVSSAPTATNGIVVLNDTLVLLREGDPVDVDGNGLFDDDAFYNTFGNDDFVLLEDGSLYFTATLRDGAGVAFGHGVFLRQGGDLQNTFCYGDGSGTACPCGNNSAVGANSGCLSSLAVGGSLDSTGTASIGADTLSLMGSNMPNSSALYFQGTAQQSGGAGAVFGDGLRCVAGSVIRLKTVSNMSGMSQYPQPGDPSVSVRGMVTTPGVRYYQIWYRNAAAFCSVSTFNLSNGLQATWAL